MNTRKTDEEILNIIKENYMEDVLLQIDDIKKTYKPENTPAYSYASISVDEINYVIQHDNETGKIKIF